MIKRKKHLALMLTLAMVTQFTVVGTKVKATPINEMEVEQELLENTEEVVNDIVFEKDSTSEVVKEDIENKGVESVIEKNKSLDWDFNDSLQGWSNGGSWDYNGNIDISHDNTIGDGALKLSVDYSENVETSWSEVKIQNSFTEKVDFKGYNVLSYDFIYNPELMAKGEFKTKVFINDAIDINDIIKLDEAVDIDGGLKKVTVTLKFSPKNVEIDGMILGIIGSYTDYKGDLYIDNIKFSKEVVDDIYVDITEEVTNNPTRVNVEALQTESTVKLVDSDAQKSVASLYSYLLALGKTDKVLYGHQNDTHHKGGTVENGTNSDTKDVTGEISAVVGIDTLSLTGDEISLEGRDEDNYVDALVKVTEDTVRDGAIITLSSHMPNFDLVAKRGIVDGKYDFTGYTPGVTTGNIVQRIMPDGDLNKVFTAYLDIIAEYANKLEEKGIPVLFRPFHENNGSWFWWGKAFCDEEAYKNLFRYTVEYLRDEKNVHNFLYVYSPGGTFEDEADYLSRYPGDEFVDVLAFDMYHDNPKEDDNWMDVFKETIELVQGLANKRGKLSAVSETGIIANEGENTGCLPIKDNTRKDWFNETLDVMSDSDMPYFMVWANFNDDTNFFAPYKVSENRGHEMINEFIDFFNDERSVFGGGVGNYLGLDTEIKDSYEYGYLKNPVSGTRVLSPTTITASIRDYNGDVKFVIKNNNNEVKATLEATKKDEIYSAEITQEDLDKIGATSGTIELYSGDTLLNTINVIFNIQEAEVVNYLVDDFETYFGEDALLSNDWATNAGAGCSVKPYLTSESGLHNNGGYGLVFDYKISTEKTSEGWAGITKDMNGRDWSEYDALQFWCKPDGNGQKLVIQITTNGEDFEVFLPEFAATTEPQLITVPFSQLKGKNGGTFDKTKIERFGIWCNTITPENHTGVWTVESKMYFDDIKAVDTTAVIEPVTIELSKTNIELKVGETETITAVVKPEESSQEVIWTTSDDKVVTIDELGKITAVSKGETNVVATTKDGKISAICNVIVKGNKDEEETNDPDDENGSNTPDEEENSGNPSTPEEPTNPEKPGDIIKPEKPNKPSKPNNSGSLPQTGGMSGLGVISIGVLSSAAGAIIFKKKRD